MWVMKVLLYFALIEKISCSYPSPCLMFIKRHEEWKKGAVLHFIIICCVPWKGKNSSVEKLPEHKKIRVTVIFRRSSISLMCLSLIVLPFSPPLPVFNLWQLLRSYTWDFHDQKHLCAGLMQMPKENREILPRAAEPGWARVKRADCHKLHDTAVGGRQAGEGLPAGKKSSVQGTAVQEERSTQPWKATLNHSSTSAQHMPAESSPERHCAKNKR